MDMTRNVAPKIFCIVYYSHQKKITSNASEVLGKEGPKVFLKQKRCDIKVNAYNRILHTWSANIDIQFVLNPYACAMYIVTYVRGVRDLLNRAA